MCVAKQIVDGKAHCFKCKAWKDVSLFYKDPRSKTGVRGRCKECDISEINERHTNNIGRALRNIWIAHRRRLKDGSKRRKQFVLEGCVTPDVLHELWDEQDGKCAVTAVPMTHIQGAGYRVWSNVTVDRIDPDKAYTRDNIRLVCRAVNYMKAAMTDREMFQWAALILNGPLATR